LVLIRNGPETRLRCGTGIRHVRYEPGEPWPAAKALGWAIAKRPSRKTSWDHRCPDRSSTLVGRQETHWAPAARLLLLAALRYDHRRMVGAAASPSAAGPKLIEIKKWETFAK
jgi:hypothetical protein